MGRRDPAPKPLRCPADAPGIGRLPEQGLQVGGVVDGDCADDADYNGDVDGGRETVAHQHSWCLELGGEVRSLGAVERGTGG